jgi:hypothetical protein
MAIWTGREHTPAVLSAARAWRDRSLLGTLSTFTDDQIWTSENITALRDAFVGNPIEGSRSFFDKFIEQLEPSPSEVRRLAAEIVWLLLLFVSSQQFGPQTKRRRIKQVWELGGTEIPSSDFLSNEALDGLAKPGTAFMAGLPGELEYLLEILVTWKGLSRGKQQGLVSDPWGFCSWLSEQPGSDRRPFRHMLLYLLFPANFERICSRDHKRRILEAFAHDFPSDSVLRELSSECQLDRALLHLRGCLEEEHGTNQLDYYLPPLREVWFDVRPEEALEENDAEPSEGAQKSYWIEKTIVRGRTDRERGEHALGQALWSPQRSKSGGDIYANMRRVRPGDVVFHLTDNEAITAVSVAADLADQSFGGVEGTEWGGKPSYRVPLDLFQRLEPPLHRESFLAAEPFATELRSLAESRGGLFYNSHRGLNQGAYLTEAPPQLLSILDRAYRAVAGKGLPYVEETLAIPNWETVEEYTIDDALQGLFMEKAQFERILSIWSEKKNLILQGAPGVGKSFVARRLAYALIGAKDRTRVEAVQFHQSYGYEDFIQGYRPTEAGGFERRDGVFLRFCRAAAADPGRRYVFIIDEVN